MANRAAGCDYLYDEDDDDPKPCKGMVYGMRPASLYLLMTAVAGFTVAVVNPIFGEKSTRGHCQAPTSAWVI